MNKPLTIDELKALKVGDWVWLVDIGEQITTQEYRAVKDKDSDGLYLAGICFSGYRPYPSLGKAWLAYKNKEMAEAKGEIVELPCLRELYSDRITSYKELVYVNKHNRIISTLYSEDEFAEVERRLAELRGEK